MLHKYDTILHEVRIFFGLTHVEYCIMNTISGLSLSQNWCALTNKELADTQSVSAIYAGQVCSKLFGLGLIITQPAIGKTSLKKATKVWLDAIELAKKNLKNTSQPQNKVYRLEPTTLEQSMHLPNNFVMTTPQQSMHSYKNKKEEDKEEYIQSSPEQAQGIYIFFNDFENACTDYFNAKCAVRNTKKSDSLEMCFIHLINNALAGSDIGKLDAKSIKAYNPDENEKSLVKSEIKKFLDGLEFYKLEKSRFEQGATGFYAPKLIKSILIKNEYAKTVKENAGGVTPKNAVLDWRVSFLPKLQKINPALTAKNLDYLLSASRICLGMIIHQDNKALIRASIGEFVQNNLDKNLPSLSQKEVKELYKNWIGQTETGRAFAIHAKAKQPIFLQELTLASR
jgi:hypothetical protein